MTATRVPNHVAFIMDGNGRWARRRGLLRLRGHEAGAQALRRITRRCRTLGVREVTFFALSTENFTRRPKIEIDFLLRLLKRYLIEERAELLENDIRLKAIGDVAAFPAAVRAELEESERLTAELGGMVMRLALNYGARREILNAVRGMLDAVASGELSAEEARTINEQGFRRFLDDGTMSDPDLVVRTAGESRLSNFLLWQASYSELWITPELWPEFGVEELDRALAAYSKRVRKFGSISSASSASDAEGLPEAASTSRAFR